MPAINRRKYSKGNAALLRDVAARFGCDHDTVRLWQNEGAPIDDPDKLREWMEEKDKRTAEPESLTEARRQKVIVDTKRALHQLEVAQARYVATEEAERQAIAWAAQVRSEFNLLQAEAPLWAGLSAAEIQAKARAFAAAAMERLRDFRTV